jgi:hypothetical protein
MLDDLHHRQLNKRLSMNKFVSRSYHALIDPYRSYCVFFINYVTFVITLVHDRYLVWLNLNCELGLNIAYLFHDMSMIFS